VAIQIGSRAFRTDAGGNPHGQVTEARIS